MALSDGQQKAIAAAKARLAQKDQPATSPARKMTFSEEVKRVAGRTARDLAIGVGQVGDFGRLFGDPLTRSIGYGVSLIDPEIGLDIMQTADSPPISEAIAAEFDELTDGEYKPRNDVERYVDTASQFLTSAGAMGLGAARGPLASLTSSDGAIAQAAKKFLNEGGLPGLVGAGGGGAGLEYGKDEFPDNVYAQTGLSLLAAVAGGGLTSLARDAGESALKSAFVRDESGAVPMPGSNIKRRAAGVGSGGGSGQKTLSKAETAVYRALVEEQGYTPQEAADLVRQAGKGELPLSLPEMADNQTLMRFEKRLRQNAGPAGQIEQQFLQQRAAGLPGAIEDELGKIGKVSSPDVAGREASKIAKGIIQKAKTTRELKAAPLYEKAHANILGDDVAEALKSDAIIADALKTVETDKGLAKRVAAYPENSVARFDYAYRIIRDTGRKMLRDGDATRAGPWLQTADELVKVLDDSSESYRNARTIFAKNSPKIERLEESIVGLLSDMDAGDFATAGKKLFSSTPTEIKYARRVFAKNPEQWNRLIASHIADVGGQVNHSPLKMLNALSSKTASGSVTKENRLDAALSPTQRKAKDALFDNMERMTRIRGGSDTAENLATDTMLEGALDTGVERAARAVTSLKNLKDAPEKVAGQVYDWFKLGVRNQNYEDLARIFTGQGSEDFAAKILKTKPGSPTAYKVIAERIASTAKAASDSAITGERVAAPRIGEDQGQTAKSETDIGGASSPSLTKGQQSALDAARARLKQKQQNSPAVGPQSSLPADIRQDEGLRHVAYYDTTGNKTVGFGFNMDSGIAQRVWKKAGIATPFDDVYAGKAAISDAQAEALGQQSFNIALDDATSIYDNFGRLSQSRKEALLNLSYQLGKPKLSGMGDFNAAVRRGAWPEAVRHLLKSKYAAQTPARAKEVARKLLRGNA